MSDKPKIDISKISLGNEKNRYAISFKIGDVNTQLACTQINDNKNGIFCMVGRSLIFYINPSLYDVTIDHEPILKSIRDLVA